MLTDCPGRREHQTRADYESTLWGSLPSGVSSSTRVNAATIRSVRPMRAQRTLTTHGEPNRASWLCQPYREVSRLESQHEA